MKQKLIQSAVYRVKRQTMAIACAAVLLFVAIAAGGAIELLFNLSFASTPQEKTPIGDAYELQSAPPYVVAIDAGHGNFDVGAKGVVNEIVVTQATADELFALLLADKNYSPMLTRQKGEEIKSEERARRAINAKASIFISLHANADHSSGSSHGFECFPTPPGRLYSDKSMQLAQRIAAGMAEQGHRLRGENGIKFAYYNGKSKKMVDSSNDKVRSQKSFGVVEKPLCPSVLVEQCFITSRKDVAAWGNAEGCKKAAKIYYKAICEYFGTAPSLEALQENGNG